MTNQTKFDTNLFYHTKDGQTQVNYIAVKIYFAIYCVKCDLILLQLENQWQPALLN